MHLMRHFTGHGLAPLLTDTSVDSFSGRSLLFCNMQLHFCHVFLLFNSSFLFITKLHCIVWMNYSSFTYWLTSWLFLVRQLLLTLCTRLCGHSFQLFRTMPFNVCVTLYMYPVSEYITEIILFFSPSQKSVSPCFLSFVYFGLCLPRLRYFSKVCWSRLSALI